MRVYLLTFSVAALACLGVRSQGLETTLSLGAAGIQPLQPDVVRMSKDDQGALFGGIEGSAQFQISRPIKEWLAWRVDIGYAYGQHRFELPCKCPMPFDRVTVIENALRTNGVTLSVGGELRTPRDEYWYMSLRFGLEAVAFAHRDAEYSIRFAWQRPDSSVTIVAGERYPLRTELGAFMPQLDLSLGRQFWKWYPVRVELIFKQDLKSFSYTIVNLRGISQQVQLQRTYIGVRVGVSLGRGAPS